MRLRLERDKRRGGDSIQFNSRSYLLMVEHDKLTENLFSHGPPKKKEIIKVSGQKKGHKRKHYFIK